MVVPHDGNTTYSPTWFKVAFWSVWSHSACCKKHRPSHLGANYSSLSIGLRESIFSSDGELIDSSDEDEESSELLLLAILSIEEKKGRNDNVRYQKTHSQY